MLPCVATANIFPSAANQYPNNHFQRIEPADYYEFDVFLLLSTSEAVATAET